MSVWGTYVANSGAKNVDEAMCPKEQVHRPGFKEPKKAARTEKEREKKGNLGLEKTANQQSLVNFLPRLLLFLLFWN
jgi:hypothetical protein